MSRSIRYYLVAYNFTALAFWTLFLLDYVAGNNLNLWLLNIAQGMAVLEIVHAILKWVKSPLLSTTAQVLSRLLVLGLVDAYVLGFPAAYFSSLPAYASSWIDKGIIITLLAWSVTEIVRYATYFTALMNHQPPWLLWMRYTFFIVLYPIGVTGEWLIIIFVLVPIGLGFNLLSAITVALFAIYAYSFPVLYKYMWKQRRLKLS